MSDITLTVSAPGPTVDLAVVAGTSVTLTVSEGGGVSDHAGLPDLATSGHPASIIANTPAGSVAATTVQAAINELDSEKAAKASNLSDLASASTARTNLGLGGAATLSVGTSAGTVAAGDDSRITGAVPKSLIDAAGDLLVGSAADTVARLGIGTAGQVLTVNSGATGLEWAAPSGGSGLSLIGTAGEWYQVAPGMIRLAFAEPVLTPGANKTIYMGPYHVTGALTLGGGVFKVQAVTGTANVRFAIISMNTSTWQPSAVVKDFGELTYTSTGEKVVTFSNVTVGAGWYFVGVRTDSASLAFSGMRMAPVSGWRGQQNGYLTYTHLTKSETYGPWASTPTAWDTVVTGSTVGIWGATHVLDWRLGA